MPNLEDLPAENARLRARLEQAEEGLRSLQQGDAERLKDTFLATLAHELRDPLALIGNALATLRRARIDEPEALAALAVVDRQCSRLGRLLLPVMVGPPTEAPRTTTSRLHGRPGPSAARGILVVDDNEDAANSLGSLLARQGAQVEIAFNGPSALERFEALQPRLIILDIGMPGMDGHEVARRIRARTELLQPTLIAMSGLGQEADRQRSLEAGFDYHLVKPVPQAVLDSILWAESGLSESGRRTSAVATAASAEQNGGRTRSRRLPASEDARESGVPAAATELVAGGGAVSESEPERPAQAAVSADGDAAAAGQMDRVRSQSRALLHDLAQPLNTIACYAVAARNLAARLAADATPLCNALRGIDQQILRAGDVLERLRVLCHGQEAPDSESSQRPGEGSRQ